MSEAPFTESEKRAAKVLKKLVREETGAEWSHCFCLRLVRKYQPERDRREKEAYAALILERETSEGAT